MAAEALAEDFVDVADEEDAVVDGADVDDEDVGGVLFDDVAVDAL